MWAGVYCSGLTSRKNRNTRLSCTSTPGSNTIPAGYNLSSLRQVSRPQITKRQMLSTGFGITNPSSGAQDQILVNTSSCCCDFKLVVSNADNHACTCCSVALPVGGDSHVTFVGVKGCYILAF